MLDVSAFVAMLLWIPHILEVAAYCHLQTGSNVSVVEAALVSGFVVLEMTGVFPEALLQVAKDMVTPQTVNDAAKQVRAVLFWQQMHVYIKVSLLYQYCVYRLQRLPCLKFISKTVWQLLWQ